MTLTLADYEASPKPLISGVAQVLRNASPLMSYLPFEDAGSLSIQVIRMAANPSPSWRRIGNSHGSSNGRVDLVTENAFSFGNTIDVDKVYVKNGNTLYDARALWTKSTLEGMAYEFNDSFINGDPSATPDKITGLSYRITNDLAASQFVNCNLDISPDAASLAANIIAFMDKLDTLIYAMPDHKADYLLMNDTALLRVWSILRQSGTLATTKDQYEREIFSYKGAKLVDIGFKNDQATKIITDTELSAGTAVTGGACTSIYALRTGVEYLTGWQEYPMDVQDIGMLEDGVTWRTLVDWVVGLAVTHPRSIARMYNITAA